MNVSTVVSELRNVAASGATRTIAWREAQLDALHQMLTEQEEEFAAALSSDLRKPPFETWAGETGFVASEALYARKRVRRWMKDRRVPTPMVGQPARSWLHPEPLGLVLIIGAWNYPLQVTLSPAVSAIAAGNTILLKPSELAPATSAALAKLIPRYLDSNAIRVVEGGVAETTALLAERFDHIVYTGNGRVGRIVMQAAAQHLTPVTLELGGKSPCVVLPDADIETTARRIAWGKFMNAGQICISPDYVLTDAATEAKLIDALRRRVRDMFGAEPKQSPDFARIVNDRHFARLTKLIASGEPAVGGGSDPAQRYIAPTVLKNVAPDSPIMQEEIFGPLLPIVRSESLDQSIAFIAARDKPLAAYLFSRDRSSERRFLEGVSAGMVCINDVIMFTTAPELPHGGIGESGMGGFKGQAGFDRMSHLKVVMRRALWPDPPLRYAPYTPQKTAALRRLR